MTLMNERWQAQLGKMLAGWAGRLTLPVRHSLTLGWHDATWHALDDAQVVSHGEATITSFVSCVMVEPCFLMMVTSCSGEMLSCVDDPPKGFATWTSVQWHLSRRQWHATLMQFVNSANSGANYLRLTPRWSYHFAKRQRTWSPT